LIGVISKKSEEEIVREFFQLFKVPWEFYTSNRSYDVVLSTRNEIPALNVKLLLLYSSETGRFDSDKGITTGFHFRNLTLECDDIEFPIYGNILTFEAVCEPLIRVRGTNEAAEIEIDTQETKILRIGFDLFREVSFLLSSGQPVEHAHIPTLEIHISILRNLTVDSGIPLIEIPPVPAGCDFITCLTHDVDFAGIRKHRFDHTMWGFAYRALIGSFLDVLKRSISWKKLFQNWKSVALLPYVYLGLADDFWVQFDRYIKVENGLGSTFFMIPFKNRAGQNISDQAPKRRSARYDVTDVKLEVRRLVSCGCEIGLHGIDAWQGSEKGREEFNRISHVIGDSNIGVRMHWLYFCNRSPQILENAGFSYDSTFGYNDAVGYRGGTTQVFRPLGAKKLLELPMHIQDTALFYPKRMGLTETQALELCKRLARNASIYGGVLVINWHQRSLGPERLWGDFYVRLLEEIKKYNVWFATAGQVVKWFDKRRSISFDNMHLTSNRLNLKLNGPADDSLPHLVLRSYRPKAKSSDDIMPFPHTRNYVDIPLPGGGETEIHL